MNNCNIIKLSQQKEILKKAILEYKNENFVVFNHECGSGKTITTLKILLELKDMKCLFVTLRNADSIDYCNQLKYTEW